RQRVPAVAVAHEQAGLDQPEVVGRRAQIGGVVERLDDDRAVGHAERLLGVEGRGGAVGDVDRALLERVVREQRRVDIVGHDAVVEREAGGARPREQVIRRQLRGRRRIEIDLHRDRWRGVGHVVARAAAAARGEAGPGDDERERASHRYGSTTAATGPPFSDVQSNGLNGDAGRKNGTCDVVDCMSSAMLANDPPVLPPTHMWLALLFFIASAESNSSSPIASYSTLSTGLRPYASSSRSPSCSGSRGSGRVPEPECLLPATTMFSPRKFRIVPGAAPGISPRSAYVPDRSRVDSCHLVTSCSIARPLISAMSPVLLFAYVLLVISTRRDAMANVPVPTGMLATVVPGVPKFEWLLSRMMLSCIRTSRPTIGLPGRSNTTIPAVLSSATLLYTSANCVFSISSPATLPVTRLLRTITCWHWPTYSPASDAFSAMLFSTRTFCDFTG